MKKILQNLFHFNIIVSTLLLSSMSFAAPIQDLSIEKLMQLSDIKGIIKKSNQELKPMYDQQAEQILKDALIVDNLNEKEQEAALKISELISSITTNVTEDQQFYDMIKNAYKKAYTEEEAQAYIAFLSTPVGKSITQKSTLLMGELMKESMEITQQRLENPTKKAEFISKLSDIIEPLIKSKN